MTKLKYLKAKISDKRRCKKPNLKKRKPAICVRFKSKNHLQKTVKNRTSNHFPKLRNLHHSSKFCWQFFEYCEISVWWLKRQKKLEDKHRRNLCLPCSLANYIKKTENPKNRKHFFEANKQARVEYSRWHLSWIPNKSKYPVTTESRCEWSSPDC